MRPLLVHASSKSQLEAPRRVLHIEYAASMMIDTNLELNCRLKPARRLVFGCRRAVSRPDLLEFSVTTLGDCLGNQLHVQQFNTQ